MCAGVIDQRVGEHYVLGSMSRTMLTTRGQRRAERALEARSPPLSGPDLYHHSALIQRLHVLLPFSHGSVTLSSTPSSVCDGLCTRFENRKERASDVGVSERPVLPSLPLIARACSPKILSLCHLASDLHRNSQASPFQPCLSARSSSSYTS